MYTQKPTPKARTFTALTDLPFPARLVALRRARGMTQQSLASAAGIHVSMIRRYETDVAQPSIDVLKKLAVALSVPADVFLFDDNERGPGEDLRLQFEATQRLSPAEQELVREFLDAILLKHEARRWTAAKG